MAQDSYTHLAAPKDIPSARVAPGTEAKALHRHFHTPASNTALGHIVLEKLS